MQKELVTLPTKETWSVKGALTLYTHDLIFYLWCSLNVSWEQENIGRKENVKNSIIIYQLFFGWLFTCTTWLVGLTNQPKVCDFDSDEDDDTATKRYLKQVYLFLYCLFQFNSSKLSLVWAFIIAPCTPKSSSCSLATKISIKLKYIVSM